MKTLTPQLDLAGLAAPRAKESVRLLRILCPSDGSACADAATRYATAIARWYKATVTGIRVIEPVVLPIEDAVLPEVRDDLHEHAKRELERRFRRDEGGVEAGILVVDGLAAEEIVRAAASLPADLIVMGTHGRRGFQRWMLGSVTEKVLRAAPCPVLSVSHPEDRPQSAGVKVKTILCPVDVSHESNLAIPYALSLAEHTRAHVLLLYVVDDALFGLMKRAGEGGAGSYREVLEKGVRERLQDAVAMYMRPDGTAEYLLARGTPHEEIVRVAMERGADLIVMGAHGRRLGSTFFGSTATQVVRSARCPVLTVRVT